LVGPEDARLHRSGKPRQVGLTPDMMMGIDEFGHAAFLCPSESTWETIEAVDPPSTRSSTKRRIAISASVCGWNAGPAASGVRQLRRQARLDNFRVASRNAEGSPRS